MKITSVMEFYYCNDITLNMEPHYIKHGIILHYESPETRINKGFFKIFLFFYFLSMPSGSLRLPERSEYGRNRLPTDTGGMGAVCPRDLEHPFTVTRMRKRSETQFSCTSKRGTGKKERKPDVFENIRNRQKAELFSGLGIRLKEIQN